MSKPPIPANALAQHTIVLGKTGAGKSSVLRLLVEDHLAKEQPVCIVDPKGDWWGLKASASGKSAGFPVVIFGGEHSDVPINAMAGTQGCRALRDRKPTLYCRSRRMVGSRSHEVFYRICGRVVQVHARAALACDR